ncbi:hypothetical protein ABIB85_008186 [Bradyrhizobium sp. JR1.5]|uniref:hypothetical protein n=1 Tax=unclassified Bradyrhizobium TaxID=2631580 RepID=UPI00339ACB4D
MLLIVFGGTGIVAMQNYKTALLYLTSLMAQSLASGMAARNYGIRFVDTVLALKAAS